MPTAARPNLPGPVDPLVALADRCVQCGLCLPACPTYSASRIEAESPRGRIALARAWELATIEPTPAGETHLDQCLGCRSCEAVCPAGVQYGALLVQARARQRERRPPGWRQRAIEWLTARPTLMRRCLGAYRAMFQALPARWRLLPRPPAPIERSPGNSGRPRIAIFVGCAADAYEVQVREALARCCDALGFEVCEPTGQTCCGSLHAHAGNTAEATRLAQRNREAFAGVETILTLASGCHESVEQALAPGAKVVDAVAFLADRLTDPDTPIAWRAREERVALHLPCTQRNVVKSVPALRRLLSAIPGLQVVELADGHGCCGASGSQMLTDPQRAAMFREPLLRQLAASGATELLSANLGCRLHFAQGTKVPVRHPVELVASRLPMASPQRAAAGA
jgi:glycolate oxidase iron-sulfur subunit